MSPLTVERAEELLKILPVVRVRSWNIDSSKHAGRAILLRLDGKDKAVIKPHTHGREETVSLTSLSEWKGGNHFFDSEKNMILSGNRQSISGLAGGISTSVPKQFTNKKQKYVIANPDEKAFYGGNGKGHRWVKQPGRAIAFRTEGDANRSQYHLRRSSDAKNINVVTMIAAQDLCNQWEAIQPSENNVQMPLIVDDDQLPQQAADSAAISPSTEQIYSPASEKPPVVEIPKTVETPLVKETGTVAPKPSLSNSEADNIMSALINVDLDEIEKDDGTVLVNAIHARKKLAADVKEARTFFIEALNRFQENEKIYKEALAKHMPQPVQQTQKNTNSSGIELTPTGRMKRGASAPIVIDFIISNPNKMKIVDVTNYLLSLGLFQSSSRPKDAASQAVYSLIKSNRIARNADETLVVIE